MKVGPMRRHRWSRRGLQGGLRDMNMKKTSKLVGLAGVAMALSLAVGCSQGPDPAQEAINAANKADASASRAEAAAQKAAQSASQAQAAAARVDQAAADAKSAADRAEAIAEKTMASAPHHRHRR